MAIDDKNLKIRTDSVKGYTVINLSRLLSSEISSFKATLPVNFDLPDKPKPVLRSTLELEEEKGKKKKKIARGKSKGNKAKEEKEEEVKDVILIN